jgi:hypothetical protein
MKTRMVLAVVVIALALTPVVLSIGALVVVPLAIALLPVLVLGAVFALPALVLAAARGSEPHAIADDTVAAPAPVATAG